MTIKKLQALCHKIAKEKGFWGNVCLCKSPKLVKGYSNTYLPLCNNCDKNVTLGRNNGELIALMHSELSEALEELRKKEVNWKKVGTELSDCVIRIMDFCEARGINLEKKIKNKIKKNKKRKYKHGKRF